MNKKYILSLILTFQLFNIVVCASDDIFFPLDSCFQEHITNNSPDSVLHYAEKLIHYYSKQDDKIKQLELFDSTCNYLLKNKQYNLASDILKKFVFQSEKLDNEYFQGKAYMHTGYFLFFGDINKEMAFQYYQKAEEIFTRTNHYKELGTIYHYLSRYYELSDKNESLRYELKNMHLSLANGYTNQLYYAYREIASLYRHQFSNYDSSLFYYHKGLSLARLNNDSILIADAFIELGCVSEQFAVTDSILHYYRKAQIIVEQIEDTDSKLYWLRHIGGYYGKLGKFKEALFYFKQIEKNSIDGFNNGIPEPLLVIAQLEQKLHNHKAAADYYKRFIYLNDSIENLRKVKEYARLEMKFELDNIQNQIKVNEDNLKKRKYIIWLLIFIIGLLLIIFYLVLRISSNKRKADKELVALTQKLHDADKQKIQFLTNISHEIRTPLTLIISPLERIVHSLKNNKDYELANTMLSSANALKKLVDQQIDISKLDNSDFKLNRKHHNFYQHFHQIASAFCSLAADNKIIYRYTSKPENLSFKYDKDKLEIVLNNLLSNAFKFTAAGGEINVETFVQNSEVHIMVKDTGIGITEQEINKIFERFYQSTTSKKGNYAGTGLGLNIAKEYIELHKGTIEVSSIVGNGTVFTIKLPIPDFNGNDNDTIITEPNKQVNTHDIIKEKETILIIEDNKELRDYLERIFNSKYKVFKATNGKEGLQLTRENFPDIIVSDVMMPICDGYELTKSIKTNVETCHIPVILLTAKANQHDKLEGYNYGADDYIVKPFNESELILKVNNILQTRKNNRVRYINDSVPNFKDIKINSLDEEFITKLIQIVNANISNLEFTVEQLCNELYMSRRNVYGKIKALMGMNPTQFIRSVRLKKAAEFLKNTDNKISDIATVTGFDNLSYFTKCFKEMFNKTPSDYR